MITQEEFVVKVRADTGGYTKEIKKLRKSLSQLFNPRQNGMSKNNKDTINEYKKVGKEVSKAFDLHRGMEDQKREIREATNELKKFEKTYADLLKEATQNPNPSKRHLASRLYEDATEPLEDKIRDLQTKMSGVTDEKVLKEYNNTIKHYQDLQSQGWKTLPSAEAFLDNINGGKGIKLLYESYQAYHKALVKANPNDEQAMANVAQLKQEWMDALEYMARYFRGNKQKVAEALGEYGKYLELDKQVLQQQKEEAEQQKKADEEKKKAAEEEKEANKRNFFDRLWSRIKAIAANVFIFRQIRNFFNSINQLWATGTKNAYQYSRATNGIFAQIMDKRNSMKTVFANSLGALRASLSQLLNTVLHQVYIGLAKLMNSAAQLIAWMFDLPEYIQARTDVLDRWEDNVESTRKLLQNFDELNIWEGNDDTKTKDMFYTVKNERTKADARDLGKAIANGFVTEVLSSDVLDVGGAGGTGEKAGGFWYTIKEFFAGFWEGVKTRWQPVKDFFAGLWNNFWEKIKTWWNGVTTEDEDENGETFTRVVEPGFKHSIVTTWNEKIKPFFVSLWDGTIWPKLQQAWATIKQWFNDSVDPFLTKLLDGIANWWANRKQTTNYQIEDWVYDKTGAVIDIEDTLRQFKRLMPWNWGKDFSKDLTANAKGGVYTSPALGLVGEASSRNNPEIITPQALLDQRLQANNSALISAFSQMTGQIIQAIGNVDMNVSIGDEVIGRSCSRASDSYYKLTGRSLIR